MILIFLIPAVVRTGSASNSDVGTIGMAYIVAESLDLRLSTRRASDIDMDYPIPRSFNSRQDNESA
jgi:hypothetical protein